MVELTVPWKEGIEGAFMRKKKNTQTCHLCVHKQGGGHSPTQWKLSTEATLEHSGEVTRDHQHQAEEGSQRHGRIKELWHWRGERKYPSW